MVNRVSFVAIIYSVSGETTSSKQLSFLEAEKMNWQKKPAMQELIPSFLGIISSFVKLWWN